MYHSTFLTLGFLWNSNEVLYSIENQKMLYEKRRADNVLTFWLMNSSKKKFIIILWQLTDWVFMQLLHDQVICITIFDMYIIILKTELVDCFRQAFIQPQLNFIRSENSLTLLWFILMLRTSEHMLWIQSMQGGPYVYLSMHISWNQLVTTIIVHKCIHLGRVYFKARSVKKDYKKFTEQDAVEQI